MKLKEKLIYLNETIGLSYSKIAERTGIDRTTISKYVNGNREMSEANKYKVEQYLYAVLLEIKEQKENL